MKSFHEMKCFTALLLLINRVLCSPRFHESTTEHDRSLTSSSSVNHQCIRPEGETRSDRNQFHFRGTALGGWLVLEPWITPSLFYQFLGASEKWGDEAPSRVGLDSYTFCTALGPVEANKQLRRHWRTWVTEKEIINLKASGLDTLRIPVGDWMYVPYGPFVGCMDGALDELNRALRLCEKHGLKAVLDIHAMKGSQNGLDNSGSEGSYAWVSTVSTAGAAIYNHWDIRGANWIGEYNLMTRSYDSINMTNIRNSLHVVQTLVDTHKDDLVVVGMTPVNEPWDRIPMDVLKDFYWQSYQIVQKGAPHWITLLHDSFRLSVGNWMSFMADCPNYAIDTHIYQAWASEGDASWFQYRSCMDGGNLRTLEAAGVPIVVGEWSLATDNCAMWLNGFNDNVPGFPKVECDMVKCPEPYMGAEQPGAPPDSSKGVQDPFGTGGKSFVEYGMCPRDKSFDDEDTAMRLLAYSKLSAFDTDTHGQFFWNFRTEFEPKWDFAMAVEKKWLPTDYTDLDTVDLIASSCSYLSASIDKSPDFNFSGRLFSFFKRIGVTAFAVMVVVLVILAAAAFNVWLEVSRRRRRHCYVTIGDSQTNAALSHHTTVVDATNSNNIKIELSRIRKDGPGGIDEESRGDVRRPEVHEVESEKADVRAVQSSPAINELSASAVYQKA